MNNTSASSAKKTFFDVLFYLVAFAAIQVVLSIVGRAVFPRPDQLAALSVTTTIVGGVLTVALFVWRGWSPFSREYIQTRPWALLVWVVCLAVGLIVPLQLMEEAIGIDMPEQYRNIFTQMMSSDWGLLATAVVAPVAEEVVFRGAILRKLLSMMPNRHWLAIAISALLFGIIHFNLAQGTHAFLTGLLLGWMCYRTGSIIPGFVFHWINNTISYILVNLMPQCVDRNLIDIFNGNERMVVFSIVCSLLIFVPSLLQLNIRMKMAKSGNDGN